MAFLASHRIVHADLSARNVLLLQLGEAPSSVAVKITDFGLSLILEEGVSFVECKQPMATRWCAPETIASQRLSHRSDAWALGATLWEVFAHGESPWPRRPKRADDFPRSGGCSPPVHEAILSCLQADEQARPSFQ